MINPLFQRLTLLTGAEAAEAIQRSRVIVVGIGGVGSWCAEALLRSGVGSITLVDSDTVGITDFNRQVQALSGNIDRKKTEVLKERFDGINPSCEVVSFPHFFSMETAGFLNFSEADYVIDAIDTLESKLDLIETATAAGKCLFSSMGMAWKLDPTQIRTADIWETSGCPLAKLVRQGLKKRGFPGHFTVVYSTEKPSQGEKRDISLNERGAKNNAAGGRKKAVLGSAMPVTATAGMVLASLVVRDICGKFSDGDGEGSEPL
jgi:tRNA A37 threonylcarbamoyladenosine dehydratase